MWLIACWSTTTRARLLVSVYELAAADAAQALRGLLGLPNVHVEDAVAVAAALDATGAGIELADALHLTRATAESVFVTFDRALGPAVRCLSWSPLFFAVSVA
jgi:predicted nucleic acid-binding protein